VHGPRRRGSETGQQPEQQYRHAEHEQPLADQAAGVRGLAQDLHHLVAVDSDVAQRERATDEREHA
jgi:hypothetical protein